jgi:hypothetical protein
MDDLVYNSSSHDAFVFFCELSYVTLPSPVDRAPKMLATVAALRPMAHIVARVSLSLTTASAPILMAMLDILTCDHEKIFGYVSVTHSAIARPHPTLRRTAASTLSPHFPRIPTWQ